ncbi:HPr family phosphocarrier protein [Spirillospora sp. CA-142024]|uniref:HPr family phosphocarrier protein n=1 Tax=Spirillospora sp. CA-142024 TaxID=3240036 RepID=UPI003D89DB52
MPASSDPTVTTSAADVVLPAHLHARPAGHLAQAAARFLSSVTLRHQDRTVDAAGILALLGLGATAGSTVTLQAEGPDAEAAVRALAEILATAE